MHRAPGCRRRREPARRWYSRRLSRPHHDVVEDILGDPGTAVVHLGTPGVDGDAVPAAVRGHLPHRRATLPAPGVDLVRDLLLVDLTDRPGHEPRGALLPLRTGLAAVARVAGQVHRDALEVLVVPVGVSEPAQVVAEPVVL